METDHSSSRSKKNPKASEAQKATNIPALSVGRIGDLLSSIDSQMPTLTYFGLAFWIVWNSISFSGTFWFHDIENSSRLEWFVTINLFSCVATLVIFALFSRYIRLVIAKNWFTLIGGLIATTGTALVVVTRETLYPSEPLFNIGAVLSGFGTTFLFLRGAALFGALPPRRSLIILASCSICASAVFFMLCCCPEQIACVSFILLPLFSVFLYSLRYKDVSGESKVLRTEAKYSKQFAMFLLFIMLSSSCLEIARAYILVNIAPTFTSDNAVFAHLILVPVMLIVCTYVLCRRDQYNCAKLYLVFSFAMVTIVVFMAATSLNGVIVAAFTSAVTSSYNLTVWAMCAYVVFQAESGALRVFGLGNASLALGTALGGVFVTMYHNGYITDDTVRFILIALGIVVLCGMIFVFSEKKLSMLLLPIEDSRLKYDVIGPNKDADKHPKKWVLACERIADEHGLSPREKQVFVQLARGISVQEIAEKEVISPYTVRAHTRSIYAKLDLHSKQDLISFVKTHMEDK